MRAPVVPSVALLASLASGCIVEARRTVVVHEDPRHPVDRPEPTDPTDPGPAPGTFEPVAVGIGFDGVIRADGSLAAYYHDPGAGMVEAAPAVILSFAGEGFFDGTDPDAMCAAFGTFDPAPLVTPFPTVDGAPLRAAYDAVLVLELHDCAGKVDPAVWGENAEHLYGPFDGARVGIGFGALTPFLEGAWTDEALAELGPSLLSEYVALLDGQGAFVGQDWTSAALFAWDPLTGELPVDEAGDLIPVPVPADGPLPEAYVRSFPWWYEDLADLDLDALTP